MKRRKPQPSRAASTAARELGIRNARDTDPLPTRVRVGARTALRRLAEIADRGR